MTFQPVIPTGGMAGWRFLERTYDSQYVAFTQSTTLSRDTDYFEANIGKVSTAEDLVKDRRLMQVALGAFGLQDDINNKFFIQKILEDGTVADDALANRLSDPRYKEMSEAFGFGASEIRQTGLSTFGSEIVEKFKRQSFEVAVGEQNETMRIGLYAQRQLSDVASGEESETTKWYSVMGQPPLRALFETAFGLPTAFGQIDIEQQLSTLQDKASSLFSDKSVSQFADPEVQEQLISAYIARSQLTSLGSGASSTSIALQLLQS